MKKFARWILPLSLVALIEVAKALPEMVEHWYSTGIYPFIGRALRLLFGWAPFSIGDLSVAIIVALVLFGMVKMVKERRKIPLKKALAGLGKKLALACLWAYSGFYLIWGLNYYRLGSSYYLGITPGTYTTPEVDTLVSCLQHKIAALALDSTEIDKDKTNSRLILSREGEMAYLQASGDYPFMDFKTTSLKPNLLGPLQSYTGYAGYLFPFSGEANVNFYGPMFTLPFTVCHEMAHQQGFGTESEANLVGFLAARASSQKSFVYSAYTGVHQYALSELFVRDSLLAKQYISALPEYYKKDRRELREFILGHQSIFQPVINMAYNLYLLGNNQPDGLGSYNYVVAWLIAYGKKYGWDSI